MLYIPKHAVLNKEAPLIYDAYKVSIDGLPCTVRECRVSAMPYNRVFPGKDRQRPRNQTELAGLINFYSDKPVQMQISVDYDFSTAVLRPTAKGIIPEINGRKLIFTLPKPGSYVLELDGWHNCLHIFFRAPRPVDEAKEATMLFGPGIHIPGKIELHSGDRIYIDPEALVYGGFIGKDVRDVEIYGGGIVDGSWEERVLEHAYMPYTVSNFKFYNSTNIRIDGITVLNSACWTMSFFGCSDIDIANMAIVGQWRYNTDGIDLCNCQKATIRDSFLRTFDDTIVLKGIDRCMDGAYPGWKTGSNVEDITVTGCVLWCGWGRACEIGIETSAPEFRNICFQDCDIIHFQQVAMDIQNGVNALVHDVVFRDIRVEVQADTLPSMMQHSEKEYSPAPGMKEEQFLIFSDNHQFVWHTLNEHGNRTEFAITKNVLFENIQVILEENAVMPYCWIKSLSPDYPFGVHTIRNLTVNGKRIEKFEDLPQADIGRPGAVSPQVIVE